MHANWYCSDCDEQIEATDIEAHEANGHHVRGRLLPDRLLGNDPWTVAPNPATPGNTPNESGENGGSN